MLKMKVISRSLQFCHPLIFPNISEATGQIEVIYHVEPSCVRRMEGQVVVVTNAIYSKTCLKIPSRLERPMILKLCT